MTRISTRGTAVRDAIADRREFTTHGSFYGASNPYQYASGQMPREYVDRYAAEHPVFAVFSYSTPIAWWSEAHGWTVPTVKYSATTSRHQSQVRYALAGI